VVTTARSTLPAVPSQADDDTATRASNPSAVPGRTKHRRRLSSGARWGIVVACCVVVVGLVAGAYFGYIGPYDRARSAYDAALADMTTAQSQLVSQITQSQMVATAVTAIPGVDVSVTQGLTDQIAQATTLTTKPDARPLTVSALKAEADRLTGQVPAVQSATQQLADLTDSLGQSQVDQLTSQLSNAVAPAQTVLDQSAGLVTDESVRTSLQSAIGQASALLAAPPSDLVDQLTQLGASLTLLDSSSQAVTAAVTATVTGSYTYLLTGDAITQGTNLVGGTIASVSVEVQQTAVIVSVCWANQPVTDPANCLVGTSTTPQWWVWSGMRVGQTATVVAQSNNLAGFFWGTVSFGSAAPQAPAVSFVGASHCAKPDGTSGRAGAGGQCA